MDIPYSEYFDFDCQLRWIVPRGLIEGGLFGFSYSNQYYDKKSYDQTVWYELACQMYSVVACVKGELGHQFCFCILEKYWRSTHGGGRLVCLTSPLVISRRQK